MKKLLFLLVPAGLIVGACAQSPDAIEPVSMGGAFDHLSCRQASDMAALERDRLATLYKAQKAAVAGDALGVFLIGVPTASLTGADKAGDIAAAKGKMLALDARLTGC